MNEIAEQLNQIDFTLWLIFMALAVNIILNGRLRP